MTTEGAFLPRVVVEVSEGKGSVRVNFDMVAHGFSELPNGVKSVFSILDDWTSYCIASISHMPYMSEFGHYIVDRTIRDDIISFLEKNSVARERVGDSEIDDLQNKERYSFIIHEEDVAQVAAKLATTTHLMKATLAIQRSNLSALIAEFDYLVMRLLAGVVHDCPEILIADDEALNVGYLRNGGTFLSWQQEQVEKRVSQKLRESHDEIVKWILKDLAKLSDLSEVSKSPFYIDFLEICQRRHLFIHNGGVVNKTYLERCKAAGVKVDSLPVEGALLHVDGDYVRSAAARVYLVGAFVISIVVQRVYPQYSDISYRSLLSASHDFLLADMTKMAERIIDFAEKRSVKFDNDLKLKFAVNRALAKLFEPNVDREKQTENAKKVLLKYDWSVTTPKFELALACIRRDFTNIIDLAKKASASGLGYQDASHFCVFREAREIEGFMDCFPRAPLMIESAITKG